MPGFEYQIIPQPWEASPGRNTMNMLEIVAGVTKAAAGLGVHGAETQRGQRVLGKVRSQSAPIPGGHCTSQAWGKGMGGSCFETYLGSCQLYRFPGSLPMHKESRFS